jgi:hypothetical protein
MYKASEVFLQKLSGGRYRATHFSEKQAMSQKKIIYCSDQKLCFLCYFSASFCSSLFLWVLFPFAPYFKIDRP